MLIVTCILSEISKGHHRSSRPPHTPGGFMNRRAVLDVHFGLENDHPVSSRTPLQYSGLDILLKAAGFTSIGAKLRLRCDQYLRLLVCNEGLASFDTRQRLW